MCATAKLVNTEKLEGSLIPSCVSQVQAKKIGIYLYKHWTLRDLGYIPS